MQELISKIKETIKGTQFENKCFIAGGFVRDLILGKSSKDIDITVEIPNGGILLSQFLSEKLHGTNVVIFERFGTAQVVIDGNEVEFVQTRKEIYTEGSRKPETAFGTIQEDVFRRDFTINSLLLNISTNEILDLTGKGKEDLEKGIIRTTSEPTSIFREDPLRMLRAIRFSARLGFEIEEETFKAIQCTSNDLMNISKERIQDELMKMLGSSSPTSAIRMLIETNLVVHILPELKYTLCMSQNEYHSKDVYNHILDVVDHSKPTALHRLAALLHDIGKVNTRTIDEEGVVHFYGHEKLSAIIAERVMKELKFSTSDIDLVVSAVREHMLFNKGCSTKTLRKKRMELGEEKWMFTLDLCEADRLSHVDSDITAIKEARTLTALEKPIVKDKLPVSGDDIMIIFNLKPGKEVGKKLALVRDMLLEDPTLTREVLIDKLKEL